MVLFASGRTDIPAFYPLWFMNRYREGYVDTRNPFYPKLVSRIYFSDVDAILFCSKNPTPILPFLKEITQPILFHITLTPYHKDIEPNLVPKVQVIQAIKTLAKTYGMKQVAVRYDPIFLSARYDVAYHLKAFASLASQLKGYVNTVIVSFMDDCKSVRRNADILKARPFTEEDYKAIGEGFSRIAEENGMFVQTCYEERTLFEYGFQKGECVPKALIYELTGKQIKGHMPRRGGTCDCVRTVDIGDYNCCPHGCKYCYANYDEKSVGENMRKHDPNSSLLIGHVGPDDIIKVRKV